MLAQNLNVTNKRNLAAFGNSGGMTLWGITGVCWSEQPCPCLHHARLQLLCLFQASLNPKK